MKANYILKATLTKLGHSNTHNRNGFLGPITVLLSPDMLTSNVLNGVA